MAALGSLRRNSFVLISVIGMALFAFVIAGVFDGSGFQSQEPIGEVNGKEVSLTEFRNQVDFLKKSRSVFFRTYPSAQSSEICRR